MTRRVLITGAGGHLGGKLYDHLADDPAFTVSGLDLRASDRANVFQADFGVDGPWIDRLGDIDTIVHLAGDREPSATWGSAVRNNIDATTRLFHHAAQNGVRRVVFASSNWVQGGRRFGTERLTPTLDPHPVNAYGVSKLCGERAGAYFARYCGLSVICLRIGWTQWTHDNRPGPHMMMGRWGQDMWLSDRDFLQGMTAAITAKGVDFAVLNLMSDNKGMRWDIETTKSTIGYAPKDSHEARLGFVQTLQGRALKFCSQTVPQFAQKAMGGW